MKKRADCQVCSHLLTSDEISMEFHKVTNIVDIQPDWFVLYIYGKNVNRGFPRADEQVSIEDLRNDGDTVVGRILPKLTERKANSICCVCKSGITSRAAVRMLKSRLNGADFQIFSLEGGVDSLC